ncbi:MAG: hypothetical protein K8T25_18500 [Planctomycetia bacterium]|nr:hypothetical protein [Planctomycetia bacterium]
MSDYLAIHKDGITKLPVADQMNAQFSQVDHFITHFGFDEQPLTWNTKAYIDGRFVLNYQIPVVVNYSARTVTPQGTAKFQLLAVKKIRVLPDGRCDTEYETDLGGDFGEVEWNAFVHSGFDLTSLGIPRAEIHPMPHFDEYVRGWRKDVVPIK